MYRNPFNKNMSYEEARETLFLELEKTTTYSRFVRLQEDYVNMLPFAIENEVLAMRDKAASETE